MYITDSKGIIIYDKNVTLLIDNRKTIKQCFQKFNKRIKLGKINNYSIFFKKVGDSWIESIYNSLNYLVTNIHSTLNDNFIDSGTYLVFVKKNNIASFKVT